MKVAYLSTFGTMCGISIYLEDLIKHLNKSCHMETKVDEINE